MNDTLLIVLSLVGIVVALNAVVVAWLALLTRRRAKLPESLWPAPAETDSVADDGAPATPAQARTAALEASARWVDTVPTLPAPLEPLR